MSEIANMPGATEAIQAAANRGYEAVLVCVVMISVIGFLAWLVKTWLTEAGNRENRMATRIDALEDFQNTQLLKLATECREALDRNSAAVASLREALGDRPCLHEAALHA